MAAREGLLERAGAKLVQAIRTWPSPPVWRNSSWTETVLVSRRSPWPISVLVSTWRAKATKRSASSSATVPRSPGGQDASFSRNATVSALAGDRPHCPLVRAGMMPCESLLLFRAKFTFHLYASLIAPIASLLWFTVFTWVLTRLLHGACPLTFVRESCYPLHF